MREGKVEAKKRTCLTTGVQVVRNGIDAHDTTQLLPVCETVDVCPIRAIEFLHEGVFVFLMGILPFRTFSFPTEPVAETIEFP